LLSILSSAQLDIFGGAEQVAVEKPTIVCISANPALDRRVRLGTLKLGEVNRAASTVMMPGGKSAHVAMTAVALGACAAWVGFSGGSTGDENEAGLTRLGIEVRPVRVMGATRVNIEAIEEDGRITEILEPGPTISAAERGAMLRECERGFAKDWKSAVTVISGSLPQGIETGFYSEIIRMARAAGLRIFLDASGAALRDAIAAGPDFVKPNASEAAALLGAGVDGEEGAARAAKALIEGGARAAAVTRGADGLVWASGKGGGVWVARPPKLKVVSTVGSGDATMGGFAFAAATGVTDEEAVRLAAACGAANTQANLSGQISLGDVEKFLPLIEVRRAD
jgi:1-phosphofructokinase family hexose kinase